MPLIRNGIAERDLRDHLQQNGYSGRSAKVHVLELAAIERPGWHQLFQGHVEAKSQEGDWSEMWVIIDDDERTRTDILLFASAAERDAELARLSEGMITSRQERLDPKLLLLTVGTAAAAGFAFLKFVPMLFE